MTTPEPEKPRPAPAETSGAGPAPALRTGSSSTALVAGVLVVLLAATYMVVAKRTPRGERPLLADSAKDATSCTSDCEEPLLIADSATSSAGLGQLSARRPGAREESRDLVKLVSHSVRVRIAGALARTEIEETFANTSDQVLEGSYRFPLPPDAQIERLALEVDGRWMEGAFVDRSRAAAIWKGALANAAPHAKPPIADDIVWVPGPWRDPALLEWQRAGSFELRIFPIPRRGERRIALAYSERVPAVGDARRYVYPLPAPANASGRVPHFDASIQLRGHDPAFGARVGGYELGERPIDGGSEFSYTRDNFTANGGLSLEYRLEHADAAVRAWAYAPSPSADEGGLSDQADPYVALVLKPELPPVRVERARTLALIVDSSYSMLGESYRRARALAAAVVRRAPKNDRFLLFACSSSCREGGASIGAGDSGAHATRAFYDKLRPAGASDPTRALRLALELANRRDVGALELVYIGDGAATMGPVRAEHIEAELARWPSETARVSALGVGGAADMNALRALARGGGGVALRYAPGESVERAASALLAATRGSVLRDVELALPEGLYAVAPAKNDAIAAGEESWITARATRQLIDGDVVLRGRVGAERFERRYPLHLRASTAAAAAFVPRLYASERIADLEREGSEEAVHAAIELSRRWHVPSRYTSLLVLESEAMFQAFGVERDQRAPTWDAEQAPAEEDSAIVNQPQPTPMAPRAAAASLGARAESADEAFAQPPPAAAPAVEARPGSGGALGPLAPRADPLEFDPFDRPQRRRLMPMRRIWERVAEIHETNLLPAAASSLALAEAERKAALDPDHRELVRRLYALLALAGSLGRAQALVERWSERDPLDPDALTARADLLARSGDRAAAVEALGSALDAQPTAAAARRLERLTRWLGQPELGCRYLVGAAELAPNDAELLADAVRCSRATRDDLQEQQLWQSVTKATRARAEARLRSASANDGELRGDLRVEATWSGGSDLDLAIIDSDGLRASLLGAPTRAVISARDVGERDREGLSLRGAKPGEYVIEVVRATPSSSVQRGELKISAAGTIRRVPFTLADNAQSVARVSLRLRSRLVPLEYDRAALR